MTEDIDKLIKALEDEDNEVRRSAASALGKIGEPAVEPLIGIVEKMKNCDLQHYGDMAPLAIKHGPGPGRKIFYAAVGLLANIRDERAVIPLWAALEYDEGGDEFRRWFAIPVAEALVKILTSLDTSLQNRYEEVWISVVEILIWAMRWEFVKQGEDIAWVASISGCPDNNLEFYHDSSEFFDGHAVFYGILRDAETHKQQLETVARTLKGLGWDFEYFGENEIDLRGLLGRL